MSDAERLECEGFGPGSGHADDRGCAVLIEFERDISSGSAVASHSAESLIVVATWSRKVHGGAEDALPTFAMRRSSACALLGVYDGLGGSGAASYPPLIDGGMLSEAHVAARAAKAAFEDWFEQRTAGAAEDDPGTIAGYIVRNLRSVQNPRPPSRVRGTMKRELPTTLASVEVVAGPGHTIDLVARWAGDSRAYMLDGQGGLRQVSRDDTAMTDALEILTQNPPISNAVELGREFRINQFVVPAVGLPTVVVCATDGCFGYVQTPALFEHVLLDTMIRSSSAGQWADMLRRTILSYTQDDASMVIAAFGYHGYAHMRKTFAVRAEKMHERHWRPYAEIVQSAGDDVSVEAEASLREDLTRFRQASWDDYRDGYSSLLAPRMEAEE